MRSRSSTAKRHPRANRPPTLSELKAVIERLAAPLILADRQGRIAIANSPARTQFGTSDRLDLLLRCLTFEPPIENWTALLHRALGSPEGVQLACHQKPGGIGAIDAGVLHIRPLQAAPAVRRAKSVPPRELAIVTLEPAPASASTEVSSESSHRLASLGKLAARVAHELNNPLDGIIRFTNLALRLVDAEPESKLSTYLLESRTGLLRMAQIVSGLLEYSRATSGEFDELGVNEIIEEALRTISPAADEHRIVVAVDFQNRDMPKFRGTRLFQVVCNLLRNAVDAMPDGGRLTITSGLIDGDVVLRVADTGVGLPTPIERIFEPFFTTKPPGKGTGLGLAICKDYVEEMHGTIRAENQPAAGAVFTVRIPAASEPWAQAQGQSERGAEATRFCEPRQHGAVHPRTQQDAQP